MTLKPNYLRAFLKTFAWVAGLIAVYEYAVPLLQGKAVKLDDVIAMMVIGGAFLGVGAAVMFTPQEITWDADRISIRALFPGPGEFEWKQLEAWSPYGNGTFLIKFEGKQAFQISPSGFRSDDWKGFRSFLELRFREKKTWLWIGVRPIRFGKK
jgi:hypothetical protein